MFSRVKSNGMGEKILKTTYFGVPTVRLFKSIEMDVGRSAPLQQVTMFAVDLV